MLPLIRKDDGKRAGIGGEENAVGRLLGQIEDGARHSRVHSEAKAWNLGLSRGGQNRRQHEQSEQPDEPSVTDHGSPPSRVASPTPGSVIYQCSERGKTAGAGHATARSISEGTK